MSKQTVIYVPIGSEDMITLTKEEFQKAIDTAYENGEKDGYARGYSAGSYPYYPYKIYYNEPITTPNITWGDSFTCCKNNVEG